MQIEKHQGIFFDDTALNGIKLICEGENVNNQVQNEVTSTVAPWGRWFGEAHCNRQGNRKRFLTSFSLQVEPRVTIFLCKTLFNLRFRQNNVISALTGWRKPRPVAMLPVLFSTLIVFMFANFQLINTYNLHILHVIKYM